MCIRILVVMILLVNGYFWIVNAQKLDPPVADIADTVFDGKLKIKLTGPDSALVYYTLDGSEPNIQTGKQSPKGTSIVIQNTCTLKAISIPWFPREGLLASDPTVFWYVKRTPYPVAQPLEDFSFIDSFKVLVLPGDNDSSTQIFYTIDGTEPDSMANKLIIFGRSGGSITINKTTVLKLIAYKENCVPSFIVKRVFTKVTNSTCLFKTVKIPKERMNENFCNLAGRVMAKNGYIKPNSVLVKNSKNLIMHFK